ncbi:MAG: CatB-related O-acetyltransferase [Azovibrio sp.]
MFKQAGVVPASQLYPGHQFGRGTYCIPGGLHILQWNPEARLKVGAYCSFAHNVQILMGGNHRTDWVTTYPFSALWAEASGHSGHPAPAGETVIGNDVWVGYSASILGEVSIGDGAVIAAHAVVTRDVAPYAIVGGNPAREIRKRFDDETIARLLRLQWWNWPEERILQHLPELLSADIEAFLAKAQLR